MISNTELITSEISLDFILGDRGKVQFSVDGLEDTNHIYRKNSRWKDIVMAVETLASGKQKPKLIWQMLVFPYNEHQIEEAERLSKEIGFDEFHYSKSLRSYHFITFKNEEDRRYIDYNFT